MSKFISLFLFVGLIIPGVLAVQIGTQSFGKINFNDNIFTPAEKEILQSNLKQVHTLPGDFLYPLKLANEQRSLTFSSGEKKAQLHLTFAEERLKEAYALGVQGEKKEAKKLVKQFETELKKSNQLKKLDRSKEKELSLMKKVVFESLK